MFIQVLLRLFVVYIYVVIYVLFSYIGQSPAVLGSLNIDLSQFLEEPSASPVL